MMKEKCRKEEQKEGISRFKPSARSCPWSQGDSVIQQKGHVGGGNG